jgi:hypothetical protein
MGRIAMQMQDTQVSSIPSAKSFPCMFLMMAANSYVCDT